MSDLNISIIANRDEALRYIKPQTEAEIVLYDLVKDSVALEENINDELESVVEKCADLEDENKSLYEFFEAITEAYNKKLGVNHSYRYNDEFLIDEIVNIINESIT